MEVLHFSTLTVFLFIVMMLRALIAHSSGYVANSVTTLRITLADAYLPQAIRDGITGGHMMFEGRVPNAKGLFVSGPAYAMVDLRFDTTRSMVEFQVMFNGLPLVPEMMKLVNHYMTRYDLSFPSIPGPYC